MTILTGVSIVRVVSTTTTPVVPNTLPSHIVAKVAALRAATRAADSATRAAGYYLPLSYAELGESRDAVR